MPQSSAEKAAKIIQGGPGERIKASFQDDQGLWELMTFQVSCKAGWTDS